MKLLHDLVVVEIGGSVAGAYCAKLFADQGAEVLLVDGSNLNASQRRYLHSAKTPVTTGGIDWELVDVIIESSSPEPLRALPLDAPHSVRVQISPFGRGGRHDDWLSSDLTDYALSGHLYLCGDQDREPLRGPFNQPAFAAGIYGFIGAMSALMAGLRLGRGQTVEVSHIQAMVSLHQSTLIRAQLNGDIATRGGLGASSPDQFRGMYPCADGWVAVAAPQPHQVEALLAVTGLTSLLEVDGAETVTDLALQAKRFREAFIGWLSTRTTREATNELQHVRVPAGPALSLTELLEDPQLAARDFFVTSPTGAPVVQLPGAPFQIRSSTGGSGNEWKPGDLADGPLAGLRVLDLSRVWAGPLCTRILSDLGADVVCVESPSARGPQRLTDAHVRSSGHYRDHDANDQPWNRNGHHAKFALGKRSLALDLETEAGREVLTRLVPLFDVLVENYSTRVMPHFGFDEATLHSLNPDLTYLTMSGFGRSGPAEHWVAYGSALEAQAGLASLVGYDGDAPRADLPAWPDPVSALHGVAALLAALWSSVMSGSGGSTIELSQLESAIAMVGDRLVEAQIDGNPTPSANRVTDSVVEGVYPTLGHDRWIAISVFDERGRAALSAFAGLEGTGLDWSVASDVDQAIAQWTSSWSSGDLAARLQLLGIAAADVLDAAQIMTSEQLTDRSAFVTVQQPLLGEFIATNTAVDLPESPAIVRRPAPLLGQHNAEVLSEAGYSADEIAQLADNNVLATQPPS